MMPRLSYAACSGAEVLISPQADLQRPPLKFSSVFFQDHNIFLRSHARVCCFMNLLQADSK
jgi:hypothetical protein